MASYTRYSVRAGMNGKMVVDVPLGAIKLRGERNAVLHYAFARLLGEDDLMRVDKNSRTRAILMGELQSRYSAKRDEVFDMFCSGVRYLPMHNVEK